MGVSADQGDRVELAAFIEGAPQPQIKWLKNGRPLKSGEALIKDENGLHTLVLENVEVIDCVIGDPLNDRLI